MTQIGKRLKTFRELLRLSGLNKSDSLAKFNIEENHLSRVSRLTTLPRNDLHSYLWIPNNKNMLKVNHKSLKCQ